MKNMLGFVGTVLLFSLLAGCARPQRPTGPAPATRLTVAEQQAAKDTLVIWLECEECVEGELDAVVKLGEVIVPSLKSTLESGPAPAQVERLRWHLEQTYDELAEYEKTHPDVKTSMSKAEYVRTYLENYKSLYQVRAGIALGAVGGPEAKKALRQAISRTERPEVREALEQALRSERS